MQSSRMLFLDTLCQALGSCLAVCSGKHLQTNIHR